MKLPPARQFADRQDELDFVTQRLSEVQRGLPVKECLINVCGVPGIGKTALLAALGRQCAQGHSVLTIGLDLATVAHSTLAVTKQQFVRALAASCPAPAPQATTDPDTAIGQVVARLAAHAAPVLLLLDGWERVSDPLFAWAERALLLPLVRTDRLVALLSSRSPLRWRQFEARRRASLRWLAALDLEATQQQLGADAGLSRAALALTAGHPFANETLRKLLPPHGDALAWLDGHRAEVARRIVDALLSESIHGLTPELRRAFEVLALFREFDVKTLQWVLPAFVQEFQNRSELLLQESLRQMMATGIVSWNDRTRSYQIDPVMRAIFAYAEHACNPDRYVAIRRAAIDYYDQHIKAMPSDRNLYLLEYLYQRLHAGDAHALDPRGLRILLDQLLKQHYASPDGSYVDTTALDELEQLFQNDHDLRAALDQPRQAQQVFVDAIADLKRSVPARARSSP